MLDSTLINEDQVTHFSLKVSVALSSPVIKMKDGKMKRDQKACFDLLLFYEVET